MTQVLHILLPRKRKPTNDKKEGQMKLSLRINLPARIIKDKLSLSAGKKKDENDDVHMCSVSIFQTY